MIQKRSAEEIDITLGNKRTILNLSLFLIILLYEINTSAFTTAFTKAHMLRQERKLALKVRVNEFIRKNQIHNRTKFEEHFCDRKVKLGEYDQFPIVFLNSFPGSGNTWTRQLIEDATGFYSGSIYNDDTMMYNGFIGEYESPSSGRTIVVKNHGQNKMEFADGMIYVVRNPYNAIIADYHKHMSKSPTSIVDVSKFAGRQWDKFVAHHTLKWRNTHLWYSTFANVANIPIMVIYYEDLKEDVLPQMKRVHDFFKNHFSLTFEDHAWRLQCLLEHQTKYWNKNLSHKVKKPLKTLFSKKQIKLLDESIRQVQIMFKMYHMPPISDKYYKKRQKLRKISLGVKDIIGHVYHNMKARLAARRRYGERKKSPRQYFPYDPFKY